MARKSHRFVFNLILWLFKLCRRDPLVVIAILLAGGGWYAYEIKLARPAMSFQGVPESKDWRQPMCWFRVFRNEAFMLGYSDLRGNPLWVVYKLAPVAEDAAYHKRPSRFSEDWRTLNRVSHEDYLKSGYDRGHMAPNYAISRLYGKRAQLDTFLMSNITPQRPKLNQKLWQRLEQAEIDYFTHLSKEVWVFTGPVFDEDTTRLKNAWNVEIPDAFYKIYALPNDDGAPKVLAFLMPQKVRGNEPLDRFVTTVDHIEELTGLDFFAALDDAIENRLEESVNKNGWNLKKVARLPGRY